MKVFLNWKQNGNYSEILSFFNGINSFTSIAELVIFLPFPYLGFANYNKKIKIGAQDVSPFSNGAFTGEVGSEMLKEIGASFALVGHSERRKYFNENSDILSKKIKMLKRFNITPVLCIGEELFERENKTFFEKIKRQMEIYESEIIVAYEPVWSIGTGLVPSPNQISEIANFFDENYKTSILYGGSVSENNLQDIIKVKNISGVLVGGASLDFNKVNKMLEKI